MSAPDDPDERPEVRTFATFAEIEALPGYKTENGVDNGNYDHIFGDYNFEDQYRCCRRKPSGKLCNRLHNWGFVARLKDNTISIVGNCCAAKRFGAGSKFKADRRRYINEKQRREALHALRSIVAGMPRQLASLADIRTELNDLQRRVEGIEAQFGRDTLQRFVRMSKKDSSPVTVRGHRIREYIEDKKTKRETIKVSINLGFVSGLTIFDRERYEAIRQGISRINEAFDNSKEVPDNAPLTVITTLSRIFGDVDVLRRQWETLRNAEHVFRKNSARALCYLVDSTEERIAALQFHYTQQGQSIPMDVARELLRQSDLKVQEEHKVNTFRMLY